MNTRLALLLLLPPLLWASNAVTGRLMVGTVPPLLLNSLRWLLVMAILLPLVWTMVRRADAWRAIALRWQPLMALSLFGVGAYNALQYLALTTSTPVNVTLIAASSPIWTLLIGALFYGEHLTRQAVLGCVLSVAGVAVVLSGGSWQQLQAVQFVPGDLWMLLASVSWSIYSWLLARPAAGLRAGERPDWDWASFLWLQALFGSVWAGLAAAGEQASGLAAPVQWSPMLVLVLIYLAVGPSIVAYRCWGLAVAAVGPAMAAFFANLTPLFAALMAATLIGEWPQWHHGLAFALIVGGIVVNKRPAGGASRTR